MPTSLTVLKINNRAVIIQKNVKNSSTILNIIVETLKQHEDTIFIMVRLHVWLQILSKFQQINLTTNPPEVVRKPMVF